MNLLEHPDLLDQLAASHALGTLRGGARRRFETLAREHPTLRTRALLWQERLGALTELQASDVPHPNVWKRIENLVAAEARPAAVPPSAGPALAAPLRRALAWWRGAALAGGLATLAAVVVGMQLDRELGAQGGLLAQAQAQVGELQVRLQATPKIEYVAVLADDQAAAAMLVTFDARQQALVLKRVSGYHEASDRSLQLWALPPSGVPRSLGVLGSDPVVRLGASEGAVQAVPALAISLEPKGGVPGEGGPTGPVLFKGALLPTTL